jgi:hypothetical protein
MRLVPPTILLLLATFALASCGGESSVQQLGPTDSSPSQLTGDGRYFAYVTSGTQEPPTVSVDIAQAFSGDAANEAAAEDGVVGPGEPIPNDHYERNPVKRAETLELAPSSEVTAAWPASFLMQSVSRSQRLECEATNNCAHIPLSLPVFYTALTGLNGQYGIPAWVTVEDGLVVRIDEQYFP